MGSTPTPGAVLTAYARNLIHYKARQLCRRSGFTRSDEEDLVQELTLRLLAKEHKFDPGRGVKIDTFADRVVNSAVKMILRDRRRLKRAAGFTAVSLERTTVRIEGKPAYLSDAIGDADRARVTLNARSSLSDEDRAIVREVVESLPPDLREVARSMLDEGNVSAVARVRGPSRRKVYSALLRALPHFSKAGFGKS